MDGNKIRYPGSPAGINGHLLELTVQVGPGTALFKSYLSEAVNFELF